MNWAMGWVIQGVDSNYDNARDQYHQYVLALRSVITSADYQLIRKEPVHVLTAHD